MKKLFVIVLLLLTAGVASAENWAEFENKTYIGGYYAAVCHFCIDGSYNDGNSNYWRCDDSQQHYTQGCAKGLLDAILGRVEITQRR